MLLTATGLLSGRGIDLGRRRHGGSSPLTVLSEYGMGVKGVAREEVAETRSLICSKSTILHRRYKGKKLT